MTGKDPVKRGLNGCPYCGNDPVNYVDSMGISPIYSLSNKMGNFLLAVRDITINIPELFMRLEFSHDNPLSFFEPESNVGEYGFCLKMGIVSL